jgi:hypothetical protein
LKPARRKSVEQVNIQLLSIKKNYKKDSPVLAFEQVESSVMNGGINFFLLQGAPAL